MIHNIVIACSLLLHVSNVSGLFEHQAGKFDWKQNYVGEVSHLGYYSNRPLSWWSPPRVTWWLDWMLTIASSSGDECLRRTLGYITQTKRIYNFPSVKKTFVI